jgi:hypothetical protein
LRRESRHAAHRRAVDQLADAGRWRHNIISSTLRAPAAPGLVGATGRADTAALRNHPPAGLGGWKPCAAGTVHSARRKLLRAAKIPDWLAQWPPHKSLARRRTPVPRRHGAPRRLAAPVIVVLSRRSREVIPAPCVHRRDDDQARDCHSRLVALGAHVVALAAGVPVWEWNDMEIFHTSAGKTMTSRARRHLAACGHWWPGPASIRPAVDQCEKGGGLRAGFSRLWVGNLAAATDVAPSGPSAACHVRHTPFFSCTFQAVPCGPLRPADEPQREALRR